MACHASANLALAIPNWVEPVRDDRMGAKAAGSDVHKVIEDLINIRYVTETKVQRFSARDMLHVADTLRYIGELWSTRRFNVLVEETMEATWLAGKPKTTADIVFHTKDELHIVDVKWGKIPVDVHDNAQLKFYGVTYAPLAPKAKGVTVHIVQPRADNMDSEFVNTIELNQFMQDAIAHEAQIIGGDVTFGPGDHCTFCPANPHSRGDKGKPLCPTMMGLLYPKHVDEAEILSL